ncbi:YadA-like family protein [Aggregatibacter sp. oral taxon 458]|uniref:YadA-like family protein n=1 Tax=Aggregatibacter sp. oral taxon 458 TaxID=712148 RepID=UPI0025BC8FD9|nr:YadA-like family protein [Aggregatibacter sp. oral taxon 458]
MNHIYKSIFNKALGVFTAVPEFASAHGKGSERAVVGRVAKGTAGFAASALAISVGLALTSTSAVAGPGIYINDGTDTGCLAIPDAQSPNVGIHGISGGAPVPGLSLLGPSQVVPDKSYYGLDVMKPCLSSTGTAAEERSTQTNRTLFYGGNSYTKGTITDNGAKNLTLGGRLDVNSGIIGVGDRGVNGTGATNSIRMGTGTTLDEANKVANSISIGVDAGASAFGSTAIGANAKARAEYSVALGDSAVSGDNTIGAANGGGGAIAIGRQSMANNYNAIAIGFSASVSPAAGVTTASDGIAIGSETVVDNYKGIAVGAYSQAKGRQSTVIANNVQGSNYSTASGNRSQVYGAETNVSGNNSVAIGDTNTVASDRTYAMGNNINVKAGINDALAFGTRASVQVAKSIAMGENATAGLDDGITTPYVKPSVAIGAETKATGKGSVSIGYEAASLGESATALGIQATAPGKGQTSLGLHAGHSETGDQVSQQYGVFIGRYAGGDNQNPNVATEGGNIYGIAVGESAGRYGQGGNRNTAIGEQAGQYVKGSYNIALGTQAGTGTATENLEASETISIGHNSKASAAYSTAIGSEAKAKGIDSIAMGLGATVEDAAGFDGIAIGTRAKAKEKGMAVGAYSQANGVESGVFANAVQGKGSTASGRRSSIIGVESTVSGNNSVAIGDTNTVTSDRTYAMGNNITTGAGAHDSLAFGSQAYVGNASAIAMGNAAKAVGKEQVSIGKNAGADSTNPEGNYYGVYIGSEAGRYQQGDGRNYAIGQNAGQYVKGSSNIALGTNAGKGDAGNVIDASSTIAIGRETKASGYSGISIGTLAETTHANSIALGDKASATNGHDALAVGAFSKTTAAKAMSIGSYSTASGAQSIVIASNYADSAAPEASNRSTATAARAIVMGPESHATAEDALAIGNKNTVASARTYAIGNNINVAAGADDSLAFGTRAAVGAANTVAIGANANAAQANSVALGAGSATSAPHTGNYTLNTSYTAAGQPNAANGTVSVGSAGKERQIQNVAAGVISATSTDAINGSQLHATNNYLSNLAGGVKNVLGGDAAVDNAGNLTMSNIGGTGKGNVNDAIAAANTKVAAGENITVTPTTNADGSKTYTVATKKDLVVDSVKAGDTTVNTDGVTIANGPSITKSGINANGRKVTGVVDGDINATSTDAVNGSQLHATNTKLADVENTANTAVQEIESANPTALSVKKDGTKVTLTPNFIAGDLVDPTTGAVNTPAAGDEGKLVTAGTVAKALAETHFVVDTKATTDGELDGASQADQKIKSGNKVTLQAGKNLKAKQTNGTDGAQVEFSLKDSISLTQVTAGTGANQVVLGNDGVQVGGNTYINNDGLNANSKVISNVADGVKPKDAVNKGQLDAVKNVADSAVKSVDVVNGEQNLLVDNTDPKNPKLSLKKDLTVDSVKAGDSTLNTDGLTIAGGPSVKKDGINAGDKKITGVADGNVAAGSTDAVNGGQLAEVKSKADSAVQNVVSANPTALTANKVGDTVTLTPNFIAGDLVNADGTVNTPAAADEGKLVSAKAVADALKANHFVVDTKANGGKTETGSEADAKVGSSNKVTFEAGKNLIAKQANTANGGATVKFSLQDDISLNSVTAGAGDNQVVLNDAGVNVGNKNYINKDGLNANGNKVANVKAGDVSATSTDAVNGAQLHNVATSVANVLGGNAAVDGNGNVTSSNIGGTGANTVDDAIKAVNATAAKHTTVVEGKNVKVTKGKNAAGGDEYTVATKDDLDVTSVTAGNTTVNTNGLTITGGPSVTRGGIDAGNRVISGVKAGDVSATSQEAVNGSQLHATNTKLDGVKAKADTAVQDVKSGDENALTAVKDPNTNIVTVTPKLSGDLVDANGNITAPTTPADKGKLVTAGTVADALANTHFVVDTKATDGELDAASQADQKIKAGNKVTLQAGKNLKAKQTNGANGAQVEFSLKDSISLKEVTAGEGANQVVLGNDGVKVGGNTYINNNGLNANGNKITNVADGVDPTDAVNKGQLDAVKGVADSAVKSVKAADGEENLVVDNTDPKNPKLSLKKDLTVDSVKAGDSTLNNDGLTIAGGPSVKKDGINAGDKTITNVAPGAVTAASKDAVNGGQLYNVANNVKDLIGPDATIDPATGKVTVADPAQGIAGTGKGTIGEAIKSVKDKADTAVQDIKSGDEKALSVTKAGNTYTITPNLSGDLVDADGNITAPATDADKGKLVTAGTVAQALANTHFVVDTKATDGELDTASEADQKIKAGNKVTLQAGKNLKAKQTNGANGAQVEFSLKDSISLTQVTAGEGDNQVVLGNDGVKVGGNTYINKDGLNANSKVISNVADGVKPTDAVNKGQLDAVGKEAAKHTTVKAGKNVEVTEGTNAAGGKEYTVKTADNLDVTSVKAGDSTLNTDGLTITGGPSVKKDGINAGDKKITNVAPGAVTPTSKDAVNGSQLYNVANNVKDLIGPGATIDPATGKVTVADPAKGIGETGKGNIGDAIKHVNDAAKAAADTAKKHSSVKAGDNIVVTEGTNAAGGKEYTVSTAKDLNVDSVKAGDTTVNNDGLTIAGGPSVTKAGINAGGNKITNVAAGVNDTDAVNKGQLDKVAQNVVNVLGGNATVNGNGDITMSNIGDTGKGNVNDAIKAVNDLAKKAAAEKTSVKAKDGRSNVTVTEGTNAAGGHEYTVDVERAVTEAGSDQVTVTSKHDADSNTTTYTVDVSDKTKASLAKADSAVQGLTSKDGNLNFNKDPNGNVEVSFNDNLNVKNVTTDRVQVANGPSMSKDGINAAGKAISNVANGNVAADSKDAVNGGQLYDTAKSVADVIGGGATVKDGKVVAGQNGIGNTGQNTVHGAIAAINQNTANNFNQIRGDLRKMDRDLRGGIAGALATAGLPQAFRPGKSMVAAAASTYRGQSGLAIGVSRISDNGKIILKVTGNTNSRGDFGGTIGAGYQW